MESPATELIRMALELLSPPMHKLTSNEMVAQNTIPMLDGSEVIYNIDITIQTESNDNSHAYQNIKNQSTAALIKPIEQMLVTMLRKYYDDIEGKPEDSIGMGYGGSDFEPGEHPIHDDNG
jgi:hypothetical protein